MEYEEKLLEGWTTDEQMDWTPRAHKQSRRRPFYGWEKQVQVCVERKQFNLETIGEIKSGVLYICKQGKPHFDIFVKIVNNHLVTHPSCAVL